MKIILRVLHTMGQSSVDLIHLNDDGPSFLIPLCVTSHDDMGAPIMQHRDK
jgi:hypothetical protein